MKHLLTRYLAALLTVAIFINGNALQSVSGNESNVKIDVSRSLMGKADSTLPEAPAPKNNNANPRNRFLEASHSVIPFYSGQKMDSTPENSNTVQGWFIGIGLATAASGGLTLYAAHNNHCSNPPCTSLRRTGQALVGVGAIMAVIGLLAWNHHPSQRTEAHQTGGSEAQPQSQQGGTLPPARPIGRNSNGATTTTIRNNTPYSLQVGIGVCPSCFSITVAAGESQRVNLTPGTYEETVQAVGSSAPPYQGVHTYSKGIDYEETFFIKVR
jgi:hypothetical protein